MEVVGRNVFLEEQFNSSKVFFYGSVETPYFKASDIATLLEIKNISSTLSSLTMMK